MFSLRFLLAAVAFAGLASAALVNRTPLWGSTLITLTVAIGATATIVAWRSPTLRAFYAPFAGVIWVYLLVLFFEPLKVLEKNLLTSKLIFEVCPNLVDGKNHISSLPDAFIWADDFYKAIGSGPTGGIQTSWTALLSLVGFYYAVHCCAAVLFGAFAGMLSALANRRAKQARRDPNVTH